MGNNMYSNFVFLPPETCTYTQRVPLRVTFITTKSKKKIPAYYLPSKKPGTRTTIIYSHGNAADIGAMAEFLQLLHDNLDVNILHYEYIGYGLAKGEGKPSESNCYESIEAGLDYLLNTRGFNYEDIIAFGTSVGSGPTVHLVTKYKRLKGMILECAFTSCIRVVLNNNIVGAIRGSDMFVNVSKIHKIKCPLLMYHGDKDSVVPFNHSLQLWKNVPKKVQFKNVKVTGADHHDIIETMTAKLYIKYIKDFIDHCETFMKKRIEAKEIANLVKGEQKKSSSSFVKKKNGVEFNPDKYHGEEDEEDDIDESNFKNDEYYDIYKLV